MSAGKIRFAIVGCGRIAPRHVESLRRIEGVDVTAAADIDPARAKAFTAKFSIHAYASIDELLEKAQFDVACVCTPSGTHAENAVQLLKAGKHVVVEKPMALRLADADRMIEAAKAADRRLFVVKQNRFNLPVRAVRAAFEDGRFGKLLMGTVRVRWMRDQSYYDQDKWRGTWAQDGGVFSNQASHHIDLLEWFFGDVETVFAKIDTKLARIECEDTGLAILKFKSGAHGVIEATTATRPKDLEGSLSVLGAEGSAEISGFAVNKLQHFDFADSRPDDAETKARFSENPPNVYGFGHLAYLQNVVDTLQGKAEPAVDGTEGRRSLELIHALYVSAETGREIRVADNRAESRLGRPSPT